MAEEQEPKGSLDHLKKQPPPAEPFVLNYGQPRYQHKTPGTGSQVAFGFLFWLSAVVLAFSVLQAAHWDGGLLAEIVLGSELCAVIGIPIWVRLKFKWRAFIPGVLLGSGLTCLVPIGIAAVICGGNWKL